jgi:hypothetical protein
MQAQHHSRSDEMLTRHPDDVLAPSTLPVGGALFMRVCGPAAIETAMGQTPELAGRSSNLPSKHGETREQGCDCPRNKRAILDYPLQHGDSVPLWREVR